jgi:formate/nitrite transporter FocA (FNT family)
MMKKLGVFLYAILGGAAIAIAGTVFLSLGADNKLAGSLLFTLGLFVVVTNGLNLFTGKVPSIFERPAGYTADVCIIWLGNFAGCFLTGFLERNTRIITISEYADAIVQKKLNDGVLSVFILAVFCGILMYVAVDGFINNEHPVGKYIGLFLGVSGFILCGFEHCIANMYYITAAGAWSLKALGYIAVMTLGNAAGGVIFPVCRKAFRKLTA